MKTTAINKILAILSLIACVLSCTSCSVSRTLEYTEDDLFYNKSNKISYTAASSTYLPVRVGDYYGKCERPIIEFHEMTDCSPNEWLSSAHNGRATMLFYNADKVTLPTWETLECDGIYVCTVGDRIVAYDYITDATLISNLLDMFVNAPQADWPSAGYTDEFDLLFEVEGYPMIYMNLLFGRFPEGTFLYERSTKRCVEIGNIIDRYTQND